VQEHVRACLVCQRNKTEQLHPAGLLLPLPVPSTVWTDVSMDFMEGLPKVGGKSVIMTVVDRFSKSAHFIPLGHPYTAETVARAFFGEVVRLHGIPASIVSDRDPVFTSAFWQALFSATGTKLQMSSAFHPQSDGQSEVVNKIIAMYLRCFTGDRPRQWLRWLPWAEFTYNTAYNTALGDTPFRVVYGRDPPSLRMYDPGEIRVPAVARSLAERDELLADVRLRLEQAQKKMKYHYDKRHRELSFAVGDWAWLRLRHRQASGIIDSSKGKLRPRFFGPYQVVDVVNPVAVRLALPSKARIHDVVHVGLLKPFKGVPPASPPPLPPLHHGAVVLAPERALRARLYRGVHQILVQWQGAPPSSASWEDLAEFQERYPAFQLEDELLHEGGRDVMWGKVYNRRCRKTQVVG